MHSNTGKHVLKDINRKTHKYIHGNILTAVTSLLLAATMRLITVFGIVN